MRLIIGTGLALLLIGMVHAAPGRGLDRLVENLDLDASQETQVREILDDQQHKRQALRDAHRSQMQAHREETRALLGSILTAEQMAQLEESRPRRERCGHGGQRH